MCFPIFLSLPLHFQPLIDLGKQLVACTQIVAAQNHPLSILPLLLPRR